MTPSYAFTYKMEEPRTRWHDLPGVNLTATEQNVYWRDLTENKRRHVPMVQAPANTSVFFFLLLYMCIYTYMHVALNKQTKGDSCGVLCPQVRTQQPRVSLLFCILFFSVFNLFYFCFYYSSGSVSECEVFNLLLIKKDGTEPCIMDVFF